jgi:hypothetical protein
MRHITIIQKRLYSVIANSDVSVVGVVGL